MSRFRNSKGRGTGSSLDWLVKDDVSGLVTYASKCSFDLKGRLVTTSSMDEADSDDLPPRLPSPDIQPPFVRPDGPTQFTATAPAEKRTLAERFADEDYNFDT